MPLTPYENIVIGNFLYGLGLSLGTRAGANAPLATVTNTQQTPLDPILADVSLHFPGVFRLLEFKRVEGSMSKDIMKRNALADFLAKNSAMTRVSRQIHWFAQIHSHPTDGVELKLVPYLDLMSTSTVRLSMGEYISKLGTAALECSSDEPSAAEVQSYLNSLGELSSMSSASGGGLMVNVDEHGNVRYFQLDDIRDLSLRPSMQLARNLELTKQIEAARDATHELEIEKHSRLRGMER